MYAKCKLATNQAVMFLLNYALESANLFTILWSRPKCKTLHFTIYNIQNIRLNAIEIYKALNFRLNFE